MDLKGAMIMKKSLKGIILTFCALIVLMGLSYSTYAEETSTKEQVNKKLYIAVIIDDFGNQMAGTDAIANLPIPLTGAVIPGMPYAKEDAEKLHTAGKEIILHVPLEPINGKPNWLGPKGITTGMGVDKVKTTLESAMEEIPYALGMNNHMGSRAMQNKTIVGALMNFAKEKGFYFVDSKTCKNDVALALANEKQITYLERDVFLDNTPTTEYVIGQLQEALKVAQKKGYAIVIGHVGPQKGPHTSAALKAMIPKLQAQNVEFVTVSTLINNLRAQ